MEKYEEKENRKRRNEEKKLQPVVKKFVLKEVQKNF